MARTGKSTKRSRRRSPRRSETGHLAVNFELLDISHPIASTLACCQSKRPPTTPPRIFRARDLWTIPRICNNVHYKTTTHCHFASRYCRRIISLSQPPQFSFDARLENGVQVALHRSRAGVHLCFGQGYQALRNEVSSFHGDDRAASRFKRSQKWL